MEQYERAQHYLTGCKGIPFHEAEDIISEFFERELRQSGQVEILDPPLFIYRLNQVVSNHFQRANAAKRGGKYPHVDIEDVGRWTVTPPEVVTHPPDQVDILQRKEEQLLGIASRCNPSQEVTRCVMLRALQEKNDEFQHLCDLYSDAERVRFMRRGRAYVPRESVRRKCTRVLGEIKKMLHSFRTG